MSTDRFSRKPLFLGLALAASVATTPAEDSPRTTASTTGGSSQPTFRGDYARSGYFPGALGAADSSSKVTAVVYVTANYQFLHALDAESGTEIWKVKMGCAGGAQLVSRGVLYIGSGIDSPGDDNHLYALNALTGKTILKMATGATVFESLVLTDGTLYVGSGDQNLYAFEAASGKQIWSVPLPGAEFSQPSVLGGRVYINAAIVDTKSGIVLLANAPAGLRSPGSAVCDGNVVFRGFLDKHVDAIDSISGKQIWQLEVQDAVYGSLSIAEGRLYACVGPGTVCGINAKDGKILWSAEVAPDPGALEALYASADRCAAVTQKSVFCSSHQGQVVCLSGESGQSNWTTKVEGRIFGCSPAVAEGKVYIGTLENFVYSLDAKTGNVLWKKKLGGQVTGSPVVASVSKP